MIGLALITDMEYIKVGNKGFTPQGVKLSSKQENGGTDLCSFLN